MLHACPTGARPAASREGGAPVCVRRQGGHGRALASTLMTEDGEERGVSHSEDGAAARRRTRLLPSPCIFEGPGRRRDG